MAKQIKKNEGPACACGRGDLYGEWLKQNENKSDKTTTSSSKGKESEVKPDESEEKADNN